MTTNRPISEPLPSSTTTHTRSIAEDEEGGGAGFEVYKALVDLRD
jgi:hypothetical protein